LYGFHPELATVHLDRGIISANPHMNAAQEHVSPYPPFQSVPMPRNAHEAHLILLIMLIIWTLGFTLIWRLGSGNK
jgi:hypothetical protein